MCATLRDHDSLQRALADTAGLAVPTVHLKLMLIRSRLALRRAVEGVKGAALAQNRLFQCLADRGKESAHFMARNRARWTLWMDSRCKKGLIYIDIPEACQEALIEQECLDPTAPTAKSL